MTGTLLASILLASSGLLGAVVAWFKVKPERVSILVKAAEGAVIVQTTVLDELREELERVNSRADDLAVGMEQMREALQKVTTERDYLRAQNEDLHRTVEKLERRIGELERNGA